MRNPLRITTIARLLTLSLSFWICQQTTNAQNVSIPEPKPPPADVRATFTLDPFYEQWIDVEGMPVVASAKVNPYALKEAVWLIRKMIGDRQDTLQAFVENKVRCVVFAYDEMTTQIPEYRWLPFSMDKRARGLGPAPRSPAVSAGEEGLLNYPGNPYWAESVFVHEFAHAIHTMGLRTVDPNFENRLEIAYNAAITNGLWKDTFAITNTHEYFAEGTQAWFNTQVANTHDHNDIDTRSKLKTYDPGLAKLLTDVYGDTPWRYTDAVERLHLPHLQGFNPATSPTFEWVDIEQTIEQLFTPNSNGDGRWIALEPLNLNALPTLRSKDDATPTTLIFVNTTASEINCYSIDDRGNENFSHTLAPKTFIRHHTYAPWVFLVKNPAENTLAAYRATKDVGRVFISEEILRVKPTPLPEDINNDGVVNIQDLVQVAQHLGTSSKESDVNKDGVVNIQDLVQVAQRLSP